VASNARRAASSDGARRKRWQASDSDVLQVAAKNNKAISIEEVHLRPWPSMPTNSCKYPAARS
jgi:hypothetical protein